MMVVSCDCGGEAPFIVEDEQKSPVYSDCEECGQTYKLKISKVSMELR